MHAPPRILIVDDNETNRDIVRTRLATHGFDLLEAADGEAALASARQNQPDLVLLDIMMPKLDGIEVCRRLRADPALPFVAIILLTARADSEDVAAGLNAGADEYLTKPVDQVALVARVKSMLRLKELYDRTVVQAADLAKWNRVLAERVGTQVAEIERIGRLKRFLAPQVAEMIVSLDNEHVLQSHRREIAVVVCDLRGFTAFSESAEPEDVMGVLREYQAELGRLIDKFEGTLERFTGDGLVVWFNDPFPCADPCERAVRMSLEMRDSISVLAAQWRARDHDLGFAIGMALGYATIGQIGSGQRYDYAAVGTVVNLAARLCAEARDGQILLDSKIRAAVEALAVTEPIGELALKGFSRPVGSFSLKALK
jgi:class 3 adenylate cyclase